MSPTMTMTERARSSIILEWVQKSREKNENLLRIRTRLTYSIPCFASSSALIPGSHAALDLLSQWLPLPLRKRGYQLSSVLQRRLPLLYEWHLAPLCGLEFSKNLYAANPSWRMIFLNDRDPLPNRGKLTRIKWTLRQEERMRGTCEFAPCIAQRS